MKLGEGNLSLTLSKEDAHVTEKNVPRYSGNS